MAPPDHGFSARLAGLAQAASEEARACRAADAAGFDWPPHRAADPRPPYELQPGTGRRGPKSLWRRFDVRAGMPGGDKLDALLYAMPVRVRKTDQGRWEGDGDGKSLDRTTVSRDWHKAASVPMSTSLRAGRHPKIDWVPAGR